MCGIERTHKPSMTVLVLVSRLLLFAQSLDNRVMAVIDPSYASIKSEILSNIEKMKSQIISLEEEKMALNEKSDTDRQRFLDFAFNFAINMQESFFQPNT